VVRSHCLEKAPLREGPREEGNGTRKAASGTKREATLGAGERKGATGQWASLLGEA